MKHFVLWHKRGSVVSALVLCEVYPSNCQGGFVQGLCVNALGILMMVWGEQDLG